MAIRAGMSQKIGESLRQLVDGEPATKGAPIEAEARYYFNFFLSHSDVSFDDYLRALSRELAKTHPEITVSRDWMRACDRRGQVASARRELAKLRASVEQGRQFRTCFWSMLWKVRDVYIGKLGLSYADLGTSRLELADLAWRYLLAECRSRIDTLKTLSNEPTNPEAQHLFCLVDDMMKGIAIPLKCFIETWDAPYAPSGAYKVYCETTQGCSMPPEMLGWSDKAHRQLESAILPGGRPTRAAPTVQEHDPTAPALADARAANDFPSPQAASKPADAPPRHIQPAPWHAVLGALIARTFACPQPAPAPC